MKNSKVSETLVDQIVRELESGRPLEDICAEMGIEPSSFNKWLRHYTHIKLKVPKSHEVSTVNPYKSNPIRALLQDYFYYSDDFSYSTRSLAWRMAPILLISLTVALILRFDLLIVSGFLFCYWTYDNARPKRVRTAERENNRLFVLVVVIAILSKILFLWKLSYLNHQSLHSTVLNPVELYQLCYLSVSYQAFGFVKRGLIPTIVQFLSKDYLVELYLVQGIGFFCFVAGLFVMNRRKVFSTLQKRIFIPALLLSPIGIYYHFNFTFGFYDMTLLGILFLSFAYRNRPGSIVLDVVGLLVHEAYIFLRLPFLLFDLFSAWKNKKPANTVWMNLLLNTAVFLLIILWPKPGTGALESNYLHQFSMLKGVTLSGDFDAFLPLSREGTLMADFNIMKQYYSTQKFASFYFPVTVSMIIVAFLSYYTSRLIGKYRFLDLCCSIFAFSFPLLLGFVGADFGRWLSFSYITWLSYYVLFRPLLFLNARISENCLYAVFLTALAFIPFGYNFHPLFTRLFAGILF
jgi:hypothetical protein